MRNSGDHAVDRKRIVSGATEHATEHGEGLSRSRNPFNSFLGIPQGFQHAGGAFLPQWSPLLTLPSVGVKVG